MDTKNLIDSKEASEIITEAGTTEMGVGRVRQLAKSGALPHATRFGPIYLFDRAAVQAFAAKSRRGRGRPKKTVKQAK